MFSYRLKQLREDLDMTQEKLAKILNLTQSTIAYYENGRKMPTLDNAIIIAKTLNTSLDYLVGISSFKDNENIKENQVSYCSNILLDEINQLSTDSLKELKHFISFLKFKDSQNNNS